MKVVTIAGYKIVHDVANEVFVIEDANRKDASGESMLYSVGKVAVEGLKSRYPRCQTGEQLALAHYLDYLFHSDLYCVGSSKGLRRPR